MFLSVSPYLPACLPPCTFLPSYLTLFLPAPCALVFLPSYLYPFISPNHRASLCPTFTPLSVSPVSLNHSFHLPISSHFSLPASSLLQHILPSTGPPLTHALPTHTRNVWRRSVRSYDTWAKRQRRCARPSARAGVTWTPSPLRWRRYSPVTPNSLSSRTSSSRHSASECPSIRPLVRLPVWA